MQKTALLFVNGELKSPDLIRPLLNRSVFKIAVDGGLKHLKSLNCWPDLLIGDLDSIEDHDIVMLKERGIEIKRFPKRKDESDLELAIRFSVDQGFENIFLVGALGGRTDQTLANLFLLSNPDWKTFDICLFDGYEEIRLIHDQILITGNPEDPVSLIPISEQVIGVKTEGLSYPLSNEDLYRWKTRGISNYMTENTAMVSLQSGLLICIHGVTSHNESEIKGENLK